MKKLTMFLFSVLAAVCLAAPITPFSCSDDLGGIYLPDGSGQLYNAGSYHDVCRNYSSMKTSIDESIVLRVQTTMLVSNTLYRAKLLAVSATNNNITIPQETWDYLNAH